jgi:hypothetical protein
MFTRGFPLVAVSMFSLVGCAVFPDSTGDYANTWTTADNQQLLVLIHSRRDIERTIRDVEVIRPDRARIVTTKGNGPGAFDATDFVIEKHEGHWKIVGSVHRSTYIQGS